MRVTAVAPATTANLGPGFDCLGAALTRHVRVTVEPGAGRWSYTGDDPEDAPGPELVHRALGAAGADPARLDVSVATGVPLERGLGSSAAAVAAGLLIGCALSGEERDRAGLLELGLPLEGHADNLAPALYGGLTIVVPGEPRRVLRFDPTPSVRPVIVVPDGRLSTAEARKALPDVVPLDDAVANVARSSGLVAMLSGVVEATSRDLLACTEDLIHQPYRRPLMRGTDEAIRRLREAGVPAVVSGAGPSVACFVCEGEDVHAREALAGMQGWRALELDWDARGARIVDDGR